MDGDMIKPNSILNGNTEIQVFNVVKKLYESNAVIDCEFVNKTNEKEYSGKPLVRKTKYGYEMFSVIYTDAGVLTEKQYIQRDRRKSADILSCVGMLNISGNISNRKRTFH